jgi:hypothetical protein
VAIGAVGRRRRDRALDADLAIASQLERDRALALASDDVEPTVEAIATEPRLHERGQARAFEARCFAFDHHGIRERALVDLRGRAEHDPGEELPDHRVGL